MTRRLKNIAIFLLFAVFYLGIGLVVSHSWFHSQIIPLWVPAGIALAVGVHFGYRFIPAIGVGSLIFSLGQNSNWSADFTLPIFFTALLVSLGVMLQSLTGSWLVKNYTGHPLTARGEGRVLKFILAAGFAASTISASFSVVALHLIAEPENHTGFLYDWVIWWLGDSFGSIMVTPLLLAILAPRKQRTNTSHHYRMMTLFFGAILAALMANQVYLFQLNSQLHNTFHRDIDIFRANLSRLYQQNLADLGELERQYVQQRGLTPEAFRNITQNIFLHNPSIRAYSWDPVVLPDQKTAFEQSTQQLLNRPDYKVHGLSPNPSDPLVVVQYVEPLQQNADALGFNLLSIRDRQRWAEQAQTTGRATATEILNLAQAPDEPGLLILQPVYLSVETDASNLLKIKRQLAGFMVGVFTVNRMLESALALSELDGLYVQLFEQNQSTPFYTLDQTKNLDLLPLMSQAFHFDFAQQRWLIQVDASRTYLALNPNNNTLAFQGLLVLVSALMAAVILGMHNRETTLAHRVKEQTHNLAFQAQHDSLTGLPNRTRLESDLKQCLLQPETSNLAILFLDLDRFKLINDSLGHLIGDQLLIKLAARWTKSLDKSNTLYRMGGDEFILVMQLQTAESHHLALDKVQQLLESTQQTLSIDGLQLQVTASIGIAFSPAHGQDFNSLVRNADTALHQAKNKGKNRYQIYKSSQTDATQLSFELEQDLRLAINTPQLMLYYQPQFDLSNQSLCGLEALVRWQHPQRGMIPPDQFISMAEETQLIIPLGWQIIDLACRQISEWLAEGEDVPCVAVNISPLQLLQSDFIEQLNLIVDSYGFQRKRLELEITETLLHQDPDFAFKQLKTLRLAGYRLALDDFGTGYSSFNRLKYMPLDRIKIDRSFVNDIGKNAKDEAIILSIISLSRSLEIEVLAEGVETAVQEDFLKTHGCNSIQGYLRGRPVAQPALSKAV